MKKMKWNSKYLLGALLVVLLTVTACGSTAVQTQEQPQVLPTANIVPTEQALVDQSWDRVVEAGVLRVGTAADNPPFSYYTDQYQISGFDPDLLRRIGEKLGVQVEIADYAFDGLIGALQITQIDLAVAALSVTQERQALVDFSNIYFVGEEGVLMRGDGQFDSIVSTEQLSSFRIGVQRFSIYETWVRETLVNTGKLPSANLVIYAKPESAVSDLRGGVIDAVIMDAQPATLALAGGGLKLVAQGLYPQRFAIAANKGANALLMKVNEALLALTNEGVVGNLAQTYLNLTPEDVLPVPTAVLQPDPTPVPVCIDAMEWVADLNYDDNGLTEFPDFKPGQSFQKGWTIRNVGSCNWTTGFSIRYVYGTTDYSGMSGQPTGLNREVAPGENYDMYVNLVAPQQDGRHVGYWQMFNNFGQAFGPSIWVAIETVSGNITNPPQILPTAVVPQPTQEPAILPTAYPIKDRTWSLTNYNNGSGLVGPLAGRKVTATFNSNNTITGNAGCNTFSGTYSLDGDRITISSIRTGMLFCGTPADLMAQEGRVIELLQKVTGFKMKNSNSIELMRSGEALLQFVAP